MRAGIYVRVSTTQQIDRDSLKTQEERLRQFCKAHDFEVYRNKPYKDEGISAKDTKRPAYEELMNDVEAGRVQVVIVTRLDRVTRSLKDLIGLMEFLQKHEVKLVSLTENIDTTGPMGRFIINLLGSIAQLEREIDSERVRADMHHRAGEGKWTGGVVPLGYVTKGKLMRESHQKGMSEEESLKGANSIAPEKGRLYVVKQAAELVRKIYQLYLECKSLRRVTHELNKRNIKTPEGETWAASSIRRILTNPTYIGMVWYGKRKTDMSTGRLMNVKPELWKVVKGVHEAIVPKDLFDKVQGLLKQRYMKPSKARQVYLLGGLARCTHCKGGMFGYLYSKKDSAKRYFYYRCQNSIHKGTSVCKGMVVPGTVLEDQVVKTLLELSKNEKFLQDKEMMLKAVRNGTRPVKSEVEEEKKRLFSDEKKLVDVRNTLLEKLENKIIDDSVFVERFDENKKQLETVRNRMAELVAEGEDINVQELAMQSSFDELCNLSSTWRYLSPEEKQEKLRSIVNQIIVDYDKRSGNFNLKVELFVDSDAVKRRDRFHFVVIPSRTGRDSWRRPA
ncbi:MAG: recombinase family protein [Candidatus Omnitrophica bacterium]|nr:recombinase family protein [Candidatus Omnitrophota bacterium]